MTSAATDWVGANAGRNKGFNQMIGVILLPVIFSFAMFSAKANDSSVELATGGLIFAKNNDIEMVSEDLLISSDTVRVRYRFRNKTNADIIIHVAFPLPDLKIDPATNFVIPADDATNFLGFATTADGAQVRPSVEQKAYLNDHDETKTLTRLGIPLSPYHIGNLEGLATRDKTELIRLGLIDEQGLPLWTLKTTFYWQQRFRAGRETVIEHHYKPSVGSGVPLDNLSIVRVLEGEYHRKYCIEMDFIHDVAVDNRHYFNQQVIEYILKTGSNWSGPIREFRLVIDKGAPENLVSFCGQNVRKISPTQFEMRKTDFIPQANLRVLILQRVPIPPWATEAPIALGSTRSCHELWYWRNSIFKGAGYCFGSPRAIRAFGNAGCQYDDERDVPLSERQRQTIKEIRVLEAEKRCPR
jgi:hypothetical protein